MDTAKLRAWWFHKQGLDGALNHSSPSSVLAATGWARSVAGAGPYIGLFARCGALRPAVDTAAADLEIHELPSARGCTYVVPAADFALALKVGQAFGPEAEMRVARKLRVTDAEIEKLSKSVLDALARGPLDPEELRSASGGAARNLGDEGKKKGLATTLPLALGQLQAAGEIRRIPINGRLDQQRYRYTRWKPNPLANFKLSADEAYTELARRYFRWIGPATAAQFQWFSALGVKAAKSAMNPLGLKPLATGDERLMFPDDREELTSFRMPKERQYVLVSSLDAISLLRRDLKSLLDPADLDKSVLTEKGRAAVGSLADLPSHAILDSGRLVGLWEYDPDTESIAWTSFNGKPRALLDAVRRTEEFIRTDLGDARSFSLDSPKARAPRIAALRALAG